LSDPYGDDVHTRCTDSVSIQEVARVAAFSHDLKRRDRLGGLIHEYSYAA
jgi:hypothetical protein